MMGTTNRRGRPAIRATTASAETWCRLMTATSPPRDRRVLPTRARRTARVAAERLALRRLERPDARAGRARCVDGSRGSRSRSGRVDPLADERLDVSDSPIAASAVTRRRRCRCLARRGAERLPRRPAASDRSARRAGGAGGADDVERAGDEDEVVVGRRRRRARSTASATSAIDLDHRRRARRPPRRARPRARPGASRAVQAMTRSERPTSRASSIGAGSRPVEHADARGCAGRRPSKSSVERLGRRPRRRRGCGPRRGRTQRARGRRPRSRPGTVSPAKRRLDDLGVEGRPKNASTAATATAALSAWWAPCTGR